MSVILLDIEGTTTPITFVYDELFPFARAQMLAYFKARAEDDAMQPAIAQLRSEAEEEARDGHDAPQIPTDASPTEIAQAAATFALWQMDHDRKATGLKQVQGWIWRTGYESGELQGVVYDDVPAAIERWRAQGHRVAIYSSGSVEAQKLIFGYSTAGDLRPQLNAYFDTKTGPKRERDSYTAIAKALGVPASEIIFCSDIVEELIAADAAGTQTRLVVRPGNAPVDDTRFQRVTSFDADAFGF